MRPLLHLATLLALASIFFFGCAGTPPRLTAEECGPFPENYEAIVSEYAKNTKVLTAQSRGVSMDVRVTPARPMLSEDQKHPGWLVKVKRDFVENSGGRFNKITLPLEVIIRDGRIVWSSDEQYGIRNY